MAYGIPGANPSLIAQQQRISALPSDPKETVLAKYLVQLAQQNKVGTPEYYMAAGEFQKRESMRKEQAAKQQQGPNVVQNITAKAVEKLAPQMAVAAPISRGVGALDPGGMGRIESPVYTGAMGGIVAFEDGGQASTTATPDQIEQLYSRELGRKSDPEGYKFWTEKFGPEVSADERALFIAEAAPEVQRRLAAGDTGLPEYMKVNPLARQALQSKDITTDQFKTLTEYFGNKWIGGEAEDPASLTRRDYIERPRTGYDLATFLSTRSQQHGAAPDTQQRMANLLAPYIGPTGETRAVSDEGTGVYVTNPMTGETEIASPLGVDNMYRTYRPPHHGSIGDTGNRYAVGMDYRIDPETGKAYYVGPYTESYTDRGHRDWQGPLGILSLAGGALFGGPEGFLRSIGTSAVTSKAAGGEVKRYQGQGPSFVQSSLPFASSVGPALQSTRVPGPGPTFASAFPNTPATAVSRMPGVLGRIGALALGPMMAFESITSPTEEEQFKLREFDRAKAALKQAGFTDKDISALSTQDVYRMAMGYGFKPTDKTAPAKPVAAPQPAAAPAVPETEAPPALPPPPKEKGIATLVAPRLDVPATLTPAEAGAERLSYYKQRGISEDPYKDYRESLQKERAEEPEARRQAGWMRVAEAGLGILGGESPYFGVNVGKGAQSAIKGAMEDMKEFNKLERDRKREEARLAIDQNNYLKSGADSDLAKVEKRRDTISAINIKQAEIDKDIAVANATLQSQFLTRQDTRDLAARERARESARREVEALVRSNPFLAQDKNFDYEAEIDRRAAKIYMSYMNQNPASVAAPKSDLAAQARKELERRRGNN